MRTGQREAKGGVIDGGIEPSGGRVARLTGCGETSGSVRGIGGGLVVLQMAAFASCGSARKTTVDMTRIAGHGDVRAIERKMREGVVVKLGVKPAACIHGMTQRAIQREVCRLVGRILGVDKVSAMAGNAICAQAGVDSGGSAWMAAFASHMRVRSNKGKASVVLRIADARYRYPTFDGMALITVRA
jgi:hypothetical protein